MMHKKRDFIIPIVIFLITCLIVGLIIVFTTNGQTADKPSVTPSASATVTSSGDASTVNPSDATSASASPSIIPEYAVMFLTADGTPIPAQTVASGAYATVPTETVVRNGYNFDGWNFDFTTPITSDTVITAKWTAIEYNITYALGDGSNNPINPSTYTIESGAITLLAPTRTGYDFAGWSDGGIIPAGSTGDKTFTASYEIITYSINYIFGDGNNPLSNPSTYTVEDSITLSAPTKAGYNGSWNGGGVIPAGSTGDKTFTASYEIITYNISYVLNDGTNNPSNPSTYTVASSTITLEVPTRIGYDFAGWSDGGVIPVGSTGDKTFTANWIPILYDIEYILDDGTNNSNNPSKYTIEDRIVFADATKSNAEFAGWENSDGVIITEIPAGSMGNITVTATWTYPDTTFSLRSNGTYMADGLNTTKTDIVIKSTFNGIPVTRVMSSAFLNNTALTSVVIEDGIEEIGNSAFSGCTNLTSVTIPGSIRVMENMAFSNCTQLSNLVILEGVTVIGDSAFENCTNLTSVTIPSSVTSIGNGAFRNLTGITEITIPSSVTSIGNGAFSNCTQLSNLVIPNSVTSIRHDAFAYCTGLTTVTISNSITSIELRTFEECTSLTSVTIPSGVTSIGSFAFRNCTQLSNLVISEGVTVIGNSAFENCTNLTSLTIPNSVTSIGDSAFRNLAGISEITIPSSVTSIGNAAFRNCTQLSNLVISDGVTSIGNSAFRDCTSLTTVTIPNSVTSIGTYAFENCKNLATVNLSSNITELSSSIFANCSALTSIILPSGLTRIGDRAFRNTGLNQITIPASVTAIGKWAFHRIVRATFEEPDGWSAGTTPISSTDLSNVFTAATYLNTTYSNFEWTRT